MKRLRLALLLVAVLLGGMARAGAVRVVSQTVGTDELLLALAGPGQIGALSALARDPQFSAVSREAGAYPQLPRAGDVESVMKYAPTIVLCADYSRAELVEQVRRMGVKVLVFDRYYSAADDAANLRRLARELGPAAEAKAERIIADEERRITALRERMKAVKPVRVIAPSTYGIIPGDASTFQDLCDHAGAENLAATLGHLHGHAPAPNEQIMSWPVEVVVVAGDTVAEALAPFRELPPYKFLAAVRAGRAVLLDPWELGCVSHHRVEAYERLARELHPEAFR